MQYRCVDCKQVVGEEEIVILNGVKDNQVLFVCKTCLAKPKAPQTPEKRNEIKEKISSIMDVIGGSK